jgi:hypothetical protein
MRRALSWLVVLACVAGTSAGPPARPAKTPDARWTAERMLRAAAADQQERSGPPTSRLAAPAPVREAAAWTAGGGVSRAVGRVFYTVRGRDYSCTGIAVPSANRSTVLTAGHCVNAGPYAQHWVFVPGYANGRRPYGTWVARSLAAPAGWVRPARLQEDVGFAVVAPRGGRRLTDVVGGLPIAFDRPRGEYVWAFGYPAAAPNQGRRALFCRGAVRPDPYRSGAQGLACSMGQGASGGPWLATSPGGRTAVYAVTSFTYGGMAGTVWAPYLGRTAAALYASVQRR